MNTIKKNLLKSILILGAFLFTVNLTAAPEGINDESVETSTIQEVLHLSGGFHDIWTQDSDQDPKKTNKNTTAKTKTTKAEDCKTEECKTVDCKTSKEKGTAKEGAKKEGTKKECSEKKCGEGK